MPSSRTSCVHGSGVETATSCDSLKSRSRGDDFDRIDNRWQTSGVAVIEVLILTPFPEIPVHVEQPEGIGIQSACSASTLLTVDRDAPDRKVLSDAGSTCILPLCFCRQTTFVSSLLCCSATELNGSIPVDKAGRKIFAFSNALLVLPWF